MPTAALEEENDEPDDNPLFVEQPPVIHETSVNNKVPQVPFPSIYFRVTTWGLVCKLKKLVLNPEQTAFHGNSKY